MSEAATVSARAAARIRGGYPWVPRPELVHAPAGGATLVPVVDEKRRPLGTALFSPAAHLALRMIDRGEVTDLGALLDRRIGEALDRRAPIAEGRDAYRVVHGEADLLPGLFVDRYGDVVVLQSACAAIDAHEQEIAEILARRLGARMVVQRDDGAAREHDGLPRRRAILRGAGSTRVAYHDAGSPMETDVLEAAKTGAFLDQQDNHGRAAELPARGLRALDAFTHHGGFAIALARAGAEVTAIDESQEAIAQTRANSARSEVAIEARCENAFDSLRAFEAAGRRFHLVVIDPPALAKRSADLKAAERGYRELNLRALRLLAPGGHLVTCSCSGRLTAERFGAVIAGAAHDAGRPVALIERRGAGRDHPVLVGVPETDYLKCWILEALA